MQTLLEYIKHLFISLSGMNVQIPWIYIVQNKELINSDNRFLDPQFDADFQQQQKFKNLARKQEQDKQEEIKKQLIQQKIKTNLEKNSQSAITDMN